MKKDLAQGTVIESTGTVAGIPSTTVKNIVMKHPKLSLTNAQNIINNSSNKGRELINKIYGFSALPNGVKLSKLIMNNSRRNRTK